MPTQLRHSRLSRLWPLVTLILTFLLSSRARPVGAHNLDQRMNWIQYDAATLAQFSANVANGDDPILVGDELGMIIKVTPTDGTTTGVGGYVTFYVPNGVQVVGVGYLTPDGSGGYALAPMKGQSIEALGYGPIGPASTSALIGYTPAPNILGQTSPVVSPTGVHLGTLAGVYADTGIFYSTAPDTAWQSWVNSSPPLGVNITNNRGEVIVPNNKWDAEQMYAWGIKSPTVPIVDPNGRGSAPWGMANGVAGPQSGYALGFNKDYWDANPADPNRMKNAIEVGPWQRIRYAGSQISHDEPGRTDNTLGFAGVDGSLVGFALSSATPLPATNSQSDGASPNAIRWSVGALIEGRPEYVWVKVRVLSPTIYQSCGAFHTDVVGGDAGGEDGGKDHLWRYYDPTDATLNACVAITKQASRPVVGLNGVFTYNIEVMNTSGNTTYSNVQIVDTLPAGVSFLGAVPAANSGPNPLRWNLVSLAPGQKFTATVTVKASSSGLALNNLCVSATNLTPAQCVDEGTFLGSQPLLSLSKTVSTPTISPGDTVQYTITIDNIGTGPSNSPLTITDYLPLGFTYISLNGVTVNNANALPVTTVNSSNLNRPVFSVNQAINADRRLVLTFTAQAPANASPGDSYCNSYSVQSPALVSTGTLACVLVGGGSIGDTIFTDWNGNGAQNAGEEGLAGVTVSLYAGACPPSGAPIASDITDANGNYLFTGLGVGDYCVQVPTPGSGGVPGGYTLTADPNGPPAASTFTVNLSLNEEDLTVDFGYKPGGAGSIGDFVFDDKGNDGVYNPGAGDAGINGVTVFLYEDTDGDGVIDPGQDVLIATTTTVNGSYLFSGLATGLDYIVDVEDADITSYFGATAWELSTVADPYPVPNLSGSFLNADFGYYEIVPGSIGNEVFIDANNNGVFDAGDSPLPFVTLTLYQDTDGSGTLTPGDLQLAVTTSSITGVYSFDNLGPGAYIVDVDVSDPDLPAGYFISPLGSDPIVYTLGPSEIYEDADFPFRYVPPPPPPLDKSVSAANAQPGDTLTFTITTNYHGTALLENAVITDTVPLGTTYVPGSANAGGNQNLGVVKWPLGSNTAGLPSVTTGGPLTLTAIKDAQLLSSRTDENMGGLSTFSVSSAHHSLIQFDLSSIPAGSPIAYAELVIFRVGGTGSPTGSVQVRGLTQDWVEGNQTTPFQACLDGVTWAERDCDTNIAWTTPGGTVNATIYAVSPTVLGTNTWDVTTLVKEWVNGTLANNGLMLETATGSDSNTYSSSEGTTPPQLRIVYGPTAGMAVWRSANLTTPKYNLWDGAAFGTSANSASVGTWRSIQAASAPTRNEKIAVGVSGAGGSGAINAEVWNGSTWTAASINQLNTTLLPETYWYSFDVAYEQLSGDAIVVWDNNTSGNQLQYSVWNGTSWTAKTTISAYVGAEPQQMHLAAKPGSDEMVLTVSDINADDYVLVWNGSNWGNALTLDTSGTTEDDQRALNVAYEQGTGRAMVVYGKSADTKAYYRFWNGSSWSAEANVTAPAGVTAQASLFELAADPTSNRIILGAMTAGTTGTEDTWVNVWSGSAWESSLLVETTAVTHLIPNVAVAFEGQSGQALAAWGQAGVTNVQFRTWTSGVWSAESTVSIAATPYAMTLDAHPFSDRIMLTLEDSNLDSRYALWSGTAWGTPGAHDTNSVELFTQPFAFSWDVANGPASAVVGSFTKATGVAPASQTINHALGEPPKAIILWTTGATGSTFGNGSLYAIGFSDGATSKSVATASQSGLASTNASRRIANKALTLVQGGEVLIAEADLTGWTATSFTLNWTTNNAQAYVIHYMLIGGSSVSAKVTGWTAPGTTGNFSVSTVGFQPDLVFNAHVGDGFQTAPPASGAGSGMDLGVMNAAGQQWAYGIFSTDNSNPSNTQRVQQTSAAYYSFDSNLGVAKKASFVSMNPTGFTLNFLNNNGSAGGQVITLALKGVRSAIGSFNKTTAGAPAAQSITGLGFQPQALMLGSFQDITQASPVVQSRFGLGAADATTQGAAAFSDQDAVTPSRVDFIDKTTSAFIKVNNNTPVVDAEASLSSLNADGFSLNWTTNDAVATQILYLGVGEYNTLGIPLGNTVAAGPTLVTAGQHITVTMTLTAGQSIAGVSPNTPVITGTNGVGATLVTPVSPSSATVGPSGATFTWVYQATAAGNIGQLVFGIDADDGGDNVWGKATSNSVIVVPPLTFQVTVDDPATVSVVENTAYLIDDSGAFNNVPSNTTETIIGGSIGDFVWADLDGDGMQDPGEPGLSGVQVCATNGLTTVCDTTDASGAYLIAGLDAGSWTVTLNLSTIPTNYQPTTATSLVVPLAAAQSYADADFGLRPPAGGSIGDTIWLDANEDGVLDAGESGLPGVIVHLYDGDGDLIAATTTDADGAYTFSGLYAGNYTVEVDLTSPVTTSFGVVTTLGAALDVVSVAGETDGTPPLTNSYAVNLVTNSSAVSNADFGFNWGGSIGDYVWYDSDGDTVQDPTPPDEGGAEAVVLLLYYDVNGNGELDPGVDVPVSFAESDADGLYLFDNLPPGDYVVKAEEQTVAAPPSSANAGQYGSMVATTGTEHGVSLGGNQDYDQADFGFIEAAVVEGHVFHDINGNGVLEPGETLLANVTVTLTGFDSSGNPVSLMVDTDANGEYSFIVPPGSYTITYDSADIPSGLTTATTPTSLSVNVSAGQEVDHLDFGVDNSGVIGDTVWLNVIANGVQDPGEPGLPDVTVYLYDSTGANLLAITVTDANGHYFFTGLADGNYLVVVDVPLGFINNADPDGGNDSQAQATVSDGGQTLDRDFGYVYGALTSIYSLSGTVWEDLNGDGLFNDGPTGIPGVTIIATCDTGTYTAVTDANGDWLILGIESGSNCTIDADESTLPSTAFQATTPNNLTVTNITSDVANLDFGYQQQFGSISGTVCAGDGDGLCDDPGDAPLENVLITLRYAGDDGILGTADDVLQTTLTDMDGNYSFANLPAGNYEIVESNPPDYFSLADSDGFNPDRINVTLAPAEDLVDQDFEDAARAVIGNRVWLDENADGVQDPGEPGLANMVVELYDASATLIAATVTDLNGNYLFSHVSPGSYWVEVQAASLPAGLFVSTLGAAGADYNNQTQPYNVVVSAGEENLTADFGYTWVGPDDVNNNTGNGAIGDRIWIDADGDGIQDPGEPGLAGATVQLYTDPDGDGVYNTPYGAPVVTGPDGSYIFTNLPPGAYVVDVTPPPGYTYTSGPLNEPIILAPGDVYLNADFGYQPAAPGGVIGDTVWFDADTDGVQDVGEAGLPGVTIALLDGSGNVIATTITDANGHYSFTGLPDGNYTVWVNDTNTALANLMPSYDHDGIATPHTSTVTIAGGSVNNLQDFGYTADGHVAGTGLIGDTIFLDRDGNGLPDPGEGLEGVLVELYDAVSGALLRTTRTDENGLYFFGNLPAGGYTVVVDTSTLPGGGAGLTNTVDPDDGTANQSLVALSSGRVDLTQDFGYEATAPGTIGGTIWDDSDADGLLDEAGNGLAGVTVVLYNANGNLVGTTVTDANGDYSFAGLPPGTYTVHVTDDADVLSGMWHSIGPAAGADGNSQSDPYTITLGPGDTNATADFGYYDRPAGLGNFVWSDMDGDGIQDLGEMGMPGVMATLRIDYPDGSVVTVTTVTNATGYYSFSNLMLDEDDSGSGPGAATYTVAFTTPINMTPSPVGAGSDPALDSNGVTSTPMLTKGTVDDTVDSGFIDVPTAVGLRQMAATDRPALFLAAALLTAGGLTLVVWRRRQVGR